MPANTPMSGVGLLLPARVSNDLDREIDPEEPKPDRPENDAEEEPEDLGDGSDLTLPALLTEGDTEGLLNLLKMVGRHNTDATLQLSGLGAELRMMRTVRMLTSN